MQQLWGAAVAMRAESVRARLCRCERPLLDGETCLRCGRPPTLMPEPASEPPSRSKATWTRPAVLRAISAFSFFRGRAPVLADWNQRMANWPSRATVEALFGSVEAACRAAGLEPSGLRARA